VTFTPEGHLLTRQVGSIVTTWDGNGRVLQRLEAANAAEASLAFADLAAGRPRRILPWLGHSAFSVSPDGTRIALTGSDGRLRLYEAGGEELGTLLALPGTVDWIVVTPEGLFDGSEQGVQKLVAWRIGQRTYPPDRFFADYYTPGLLARLIAGERPRPHVDLASLKLPPDLRVSASPKGGAQALVTVEAVDQGGGVAEVRLYHNGKLVAAREATRGAQRPVYEFEVELVAGENVFRAVASSDERVDSNEEQVRVVHEAREPARPVLHVLAVGINRYEDPSLDLSFARPTPRRSRTSSSSGGRRSSRP